MPIASREALLGAAGKLRSERVPAPELGEGMEVLVREMTAAAREKFYAGLMIEDADDLDQHGNPKQKQRVGEIYARWVVFTAVNEDHSAMFAEADVGAVGKLPADLVARLALAAKRLNGIGAEETEAARKN